MNKLTKAQEKRFDERFRHRQNCKSVLVDNRIGCDCDYEPFKQYLAEECERAYTKGWNDGIKAQQNEAFERIKEIEKGLK
jgi:hypothetical protein